MRCCFAASQVRCSSAIPSAAKSFATLPIIPLCGIPLRVSPFALGERQRLNVTFPPLKFTSLYLHFHFDSFLPSGRCRYLTDRASVTLHVRLVVVTFRALRETYGRHSSVVDRRGRYETRYHGGILVPIAWKQAELDLSRVRLNEFRLLEGCEGGLCRRRCDCARGGLYLIFEPW